MTPHHRLCLTPLVWRSVVDDNLDPCLVPWCPTCEAPVVAVEMSGHFSDIPVDASALADHAALLSLAEKARRVQ